MLKEIAENTKEYQKAPAEVSKDAKRGPRRRDLFKRGDSTGRLLTVLGVCCQSPGVPATIPCTINEEEMLRDMLIKLRLKDIFITMVEDGKTISIVSKFQGEAR